MGSLQYHNVNTGRAEIEYTKSALRAHQEPNTKRKDI